MCIILDLYRLNNTIKEGVSRLSSVQAAGGLKFEKTGRAYDFAFELEVYIIQVGKRSTHFSQYWLI